MSMSTNTEWAKQLAKKTAEHQMPKQNNNADSAAVMENQMKNNWRQNAHQAMNPTLRGQHRKSERSCKMKMNKEDVIDRDKNTSIDRSVLD